MDHLEKSSEGTPYEEDAHKMVHFYRTKEASLMDTPEHVAKVVKRIIEAKHPKTRYQNNIISKTLVFMSRHASDRMLDWIVKSAVRS